MGPIQRSRKMKLAKKKAWLNAAAASLASGKEPSDWWLDFSKRIRGTLTLPRDVDNFKSVFKISRKTFNYICSLVRKDLVSKPATFFCNDGKVLSADEQVAVALRRLSSGDSLLNVGASFGMNQSVVSQVTWKFIEAMEEKGLHHLRWPDSGQEIQRIKSRFEKICGLPNCCGAIDTTHIRMVLSSVDRQNEVWIDEEKNYSMILQVVVDSDMRFRDVIIGWPGSMNDCQVLYSSGFFKLCDKAARLNSNKVELSEGFKAREYIVGDTGFPLLPWLLTPYQGKDLSDAKVEFNKRLFATMLVAKRALARLKNMWQVIEKELWRPDKHRLPRIILVCCLLHNIIIDLEDEVQDEMPLSHIHDSGYKQQFCDIVDQNGSQLRDKLSNYLSEMR